MSEEEPVPVMTNAEIQSVQRPWERIFNIPTPIAWPTSTGTNTWTPIRPDTMTLVRSVSLSVAELRETGSRKAFRKLLGDRLNGIYQELLTLWEREHPEATE